ncbi:hypothetical protein SAMN05421759_11094 [Roseivivax lentus]|uniref:BNR repeat-like domain-containing protein n=1 Tax=Roseivivax lentus TaxID=633194 RepID=A0A1N7NVB5_9RHOB|nr:exo-alpha-sialidase [Roseivivax lentus]SIT02274.1 hypothetical protein SAMN05421759_11094 [Roseivivax lentus]
MSKRPTPEDIARRAGRLGGKAGLLGLLMAALLLWPPHSGAAQAGAKLVAQIEEIAVPAPPGAHEPSLALHKGAVYMSWLAPAGERTRVMMAILSAEGWSAPRVVHEGTDLFVNWADFPGIAILDDGTIAVHWLARSGPSYFDYRVEIALSRDDGMSWVPPLIPHGDRSPGQHGFVSMQPTGAGGLAVIWLDAREEASAVPAMQLRATTLTGDGALGEDVAVDLQTCSCCQTSLAATGTGTILAAYRDRTDGEIRDISVARWTAEGWQAPVPVHADGWLIDGCPVNGPAIGADGHRAVVAWFTGAEGVAAVKLAFSEDGGRSFGAPVRVDGGDDGGVGGGDPVGRVDVALLGDGSALVSWVAWRAEGEDLMLCRVEPGAGCSAPAVLATNRAGASVNFPRMVRRGRDVFIAWTQPDGTGDRIEMRRVRLTQRD